MYRKLTLLTVLVLAVMTGSTYAQSIESEVEGSDGEIILDHRDSEVFVCKPDSMPKTSLLEKAESEVKKFFDPEGYEGEYPESCKLWTRTLLLDDGGDFKAYHLEVMKFEDQAGEALLTVERNGEGVSYAEIYVGNESAGATDADGMNKVNLTESFEVTVNTSDGELNLETG